MTSNDQAASGPAGAPVASQYAGAPRVQQALHSVTYAAPQAHHQQQQVQVHHQQQQAHHQQAHHQQMLASMPQATQMDAACSQLMMNPHTAAMVVSVAAAAAQQMAQQQQHQQHHQQQHQQHHQQHHAMSQAQAMQSQAQAQAQAMHTTASASQKQQPHQLVYHPAPPPSGTSPSSQQMALPHHLAALLRMPGQAPAVYSHGAPVAPAQVVKSSNVSSGPTTALLSNMQSWKLKQLEAHVHMLRDTNQTIPQSVAMLLADARRKEDKRSAKRVANRKSACTSRARKKALVEEMTRTNARLKRQAMILALLPDLVIAITIGGEITFCSAQVERVLRHKNEDLVGANLEDLLTPASRRSLNELVGELVEAERAAAGNVPAAAAAPPLGQQAPNESFSGSSNGAAVVSDQSYPPLSVVKVESQQSLTEEKLTEENSELSTTNNELKRSPSATASASNGSLAQQSANSSVGNSKTERKEKQQSSDGSLSSSSDNKNLLKANENLDRNVRWHNENNKASKAESCHKDDVTGEAVTANNAGARLSSLQHRPETMRKNLENLEANSNSDSSDSLLEGVDEKKKAAKDKPSNGSTSDDSGYRESREDTSSSEGDELSSGNAQVQRSKPLAPTCNICLIRDDLTTIWCEVTSSIRTRSLKDEAADAIPMELLSPNPKQSSNMSCSDEAEDSSKDEVKELLLCLRPIRDGNEKVDATLRFLPAKKKADQGIIEIVDTNNGSTEEESTKGPVKKRPVQQRESSSSIDATNTTKETSESSQGEQPVAKKARMGKEDDPEKSVVECLMLMGKK